MSPKVQTESKAETTTYYYLTICIDRVKQPELLEMALGFSVLFCKAMGLLQILSYLPDPCVYLMYPRVPKWTLEMARQKTCCLNCFISEAETAEFMYLDGNF